MLLVLRKCTIFLALLLTLFFVTGLASAPVVSATQVEADQCCNHESAPEFPVDDGDCFDCSCLSCLVGIHVPNRLESFTLSITAVYSPLFSEDPPAGFPRSIDYPPEVV